MNNFLKVIYYGYWYMVQCYWNFNCIHVKIVATLYYAFTMCQELYQADYNYSCIFLFMYLHWHWEKQSLTEIGKNHSQGANLGLTDYKSSYFNYHALHNQVVFILSQMFFLCSIIKTDMLARSPCECIAKCPQ
jgi:hypothetical protein